jgi:hypothetical protein
MNQPCCYVYGPPAATLLLSCVYGPPTATLLRSCVYGPPAATLLLSCVYGPPTARLLLSCVYGPPTATLPDPSWRYVAFRHPQKASQAPTDAACLLSLLQDTPLAAMVACCGEKRQLLLYACLLGFCAHLVLLSACCVPCPTPAGANLTTCCLPTAQPPGLPLKCVQPAPADKL